MAVNGVSITIQRNEILCVVGESGSGKSVMAKSILGLLPAPHVRVASGAIRFGGQDLVTASEDHLRSIRGGHFTADDHFGFEASSWYWHFVDVVWVMLFLFVYII